MTDSPPSERLRQAFIHALDPRGDVARAFAEQLKAALPWMEPAAAWKSAADILARRQAEQKKGLPATTEHDTAGLPPGKMDELVEWLAQPRGGVAPNSADALIHIYANAKAQRELHAALADKVFPPGGAFEKTLAQSLRKADPAIAEEEAARAAADFVHIRRLRAQGVTAALKSGGPAEQQAVALAEKLRRGSDNAAARTHASPVPPHPASSADKLGEDISFGMQQTFACWATDFIDPYVGKWFQDKFKDDHHHSTLGHTWGGEIVGDSLAFFMFLGVQRFAPQPVRWLKEAAKAALNPLYEWTGKKSLKQWAVKHHADERSDAYHKKMEEWKEFQADNFARSSVISASSIVANVATQKAMGNTHTLSVITASKFVGAAITMAAMLGLRFTIPKTTQQMDEELSERYFTPLIRSTQRFMGATVSDKPVPIHGSHITVDSIVQSGPERDAEAARALT